MELRSSLLGRRCSSVPESSAPGPGKQGGARVGLQLYVKELILVSYLLIIVFFSMRTVNRLLSILSCT